MPTRVALDIAGPLPSSSEPKLRAIQADVEKDRLEPAEQAACSLLEEDPRQPHVFVLLSQIASRRNDDEAAADFLRNAWLLSPESQSLLAEAVCAQVDANRPEDARDLLIRANGLSGGPESMVDQVRPRVRNQGAWLRLLDAMGLAPDSQEVIVAPPGELLVAGVEDSFESGPEFDGGSEGLGAGGESSAMDHAVLEQGLSEMATLSGEGDSSILPGSSPFAVTPAHQLAQRTACPGLSRYLYALPPTWDVPRTDELVGQSTQAINKALDFFESMHFRGMWPLSFSVAGITTPSSGHEDRPRDFRWELGQPGFARLQIAHVIAGYEASKHPVGLKHVVRSAKALAVHQHRLGGWATTYRVRKVTGRGMPASFPTNALWLGDDSTTTTLCLLMYVSQQVDVPMVTTAAERAIQAIMQSQNVDGSWPMAWVEQERARAELDRQYGHANVIHGVFENAMRALALARYAMSRLDVVPALNAATNWLLEHQVDGAAPGWLASYDASGGPGPSGPAVSLQATCSAIDALCFGALVGQKSRCIDAAKRALKWVETFDRVGNPLEDLYDARSGRPIDALEKPWESYRIQQTLTYLRRRVVEDLMGASPVPEKILRGRILHDAEDMAPMVAAIVQNQRPSGMWADSSDRAVPAGSFVWTLAQFILQYQAGQSYIPLDMGRRGHWQDFLMPDRQWLRVEN